VDIVIAAPLKDEDVAQVEEKQTLTKGGRFPALRKLMSKLRNPFHTGWAKASDGNPPSNVFENFVMSVREPDSSTRKESDMSCNYTPQEIERLVVRVYRDVLGDKSITKFSRFGPGKEIDIDPDARRAFFFPLKQKIDRLPECEITKLTPEDVQRAKTVAQIIDAIVEELGAVAV